MIFVATTYKLSSIISCFVFEDACWKKSDSRNKVVKDESNKNNKKLPTATKFYFAQLEVTI